MSIKLALFKSGENVIADIKELVDENEKVISLVFSNPYIVRLLTPELLMENSLGLNDEVQHRVSFSPWLVLSQDKQVAVDPKWVVTIVNPHEWIKSSYEEKMNSVVDAVKQNDDSQLIENFEVITEEKDGK